MLQEKNKKILKALLKAILSKENTIVAVYDTEEFIIKSKDVDEIIKAIDGGDEEIRIDATHTLTGFISGSFYIQPYEEGSDILVDYTDNEYCDSIVDIWEASIKKAEDYVNNIDYMYMSVYVRKDNVDCTNGGISSRSNKIYLFKEYLDKDEIIRFMKDILKENEEQAFIVETLKMGNHIYQRAIQVCPKLGILMAGGNYAYSSDSKYEKISGIPYPISLHDRVE